MLWFLAAASLAAETPLDPSAYAQRFAIRDTHDRDYVDIEACLRAWPGHPFTTPESRRFRVIESAVRVMGMGSQETVDVTATSYPQLILVRPNVSVMTRTTWRLENPNGWYCFDSTVAVMASGVVALGCGSHLADGHEAVEFLSDNPSNQRAGGVSVIGSLTVQRASGCPDSAPAAPAAPVVVVPAVPPTPVPE